MKNNNKLVLSILVGSLMLYPVATFADMDEVTMAGELATEQTISGTIVSVESEEGTVAIQYALQNDELTTELSVFNFSPSSTLTKNGEEVTIIDLNEGDNVSVNFTIDGDGNKVISSLAVK